MRVSQDGGDASPVTKIDEKRSERTHRWPDALPGGAVLFTCDDNSSTEYYDDARIEGVRPATGERKVIVEGSSMARYATSGHLVFARGGSLYAIRFDPEALTASGSPVLVAQDVATLVGTGAARFAIAGDGSALWVPGNAEVAYRQVWIDRAGAEVSVPLPPAPYNELALSPDGKRLALVGGEGGVADLWVYDFARDSLSRLSVGQFIQRPVWSPDGKSIAYGTRLQGQKTRGNTWQLAIKPADGSRDETVLLERERGHTPSSFTPDGKTLIFDALDSGATRRDIFSLAIEGKHEPVPLVTGPFIKQSAMVSPDGHWLAYVSDESGQPGVYVRPFPSGEGRWQISTPRGLEPRWSPDGRELFYRTDSVMFAVAIDTSHGFTAGRPEQQFDRAGTGIGLSTFGLSPDGKRFCTFRFPEGQGERRMVYLDQGFVRRLSGEGAR
jgi:serine/threonine-protein kinase